MQGREGGRVVSRTPAQSMKHTAVQQNRLWPALYRSLIQIHIRICFVFSSGLLRFGIIFLNERIQLVRMADQLVAGQEENSDMAGARFEVSSDTGS